MFTKIREKIIAECSLSFNNMKCIHQVDDVVFLQYLPSFAMPCQINEKVTFTLVR